ncbi:hypothetical protein KM043_018572 [Ampulex compressa]|nr:hypothetical protein KM043_018572 [Ampulex compressa]
MQITISLCLLVTIFKLAAGGIIKRDADTEISNFDALEIQQNIKKQLLVLLSHGVTKWQNANTFSIMQQIPDELFNIKVQQELNDVQAAIVLWLLASIYGLEIASVVKRDVGVESFNTDHTQGNIQIKVNNLMLESITDWRDIQLFLSIMHKNASLVFETKLMQELHNVRLAVETAHENGTDASYCIEDTENTFVVFQQDVEVKLNPTNRNQSCQGNPKYLSRV